MRNIFFILLFLPFLGVAQPTEVAAKKIRATEKLQLSDKTLTAIVEAITVLSTHAQSPTAKAVYDLTAAMITSVSTNATLSGNGTAGDPLGIAQQSATSGQVLKWNGSAWLPAADDNTTQTLSYSAPNLSLSGGGGSVAIPQGDITGSGTGDQMTFFTGTKTVTGSSRFTVNNSSLAGLIVDGGDGAGGNGSYVLFRKDGTNNFVFGAESAFFGGTGTGGSIFQYGNNPFFFCTNSSKRMTLLGNGNFGIATTNPLQPLHVVGAARITGSGSTATSITGRDASNDITNVTVGTGLSLSGGTLSSTATGTVGGTGIANKVAYWSGTNTLTATNNFAFDGTNLSVGTATPGAGRLNVVGNNSSVSFQVNAGTLPSFGSTIQTTATAAAGETIYGLDMTGNTTGVTTTNYLHRLENSGTGSTILQVNTASAGGDPAVQYNLVGAATKWIHGIDNSSEGNSFKLQPFAQLGGGATGLTITTDGKFGINKEGPGASIDMDATTDGIALSSGNTANRPASSLRWLRYNSSMSGLETRTASANWHVLNSSQSVSLTAGAALGTAPTITINNGTEMAYTVSLTVGTAPTANAVIFTRTFPNTWSVAPTPMVFQANQLTASEYNKFYVDTQTTGQYTIRANGTLTAGQTYKLNIQVRN